MARRLPVYLLLDTSGSMYGEPIEAVRTGIQTMLSALQSDPYALETAHLSVITFSDSAQQVSPLTEIASFQEPNIKAGGLTSLGDALRLLADRVEAEVTKTTADTKGDWKPLVFIMSDGAPTDDVESGIQALKKVKLGTVVACAAGPNATDDVLKKVTENVVRLDTLESSAIKSFFKWVSASVSVSSKKVDSTGNEGGIDDLPPPPPTISIA